MSTHWQASRFLSPRYWPTWLLLGTMRISILLPHRMLLFLGATLGNLVYLLMRSRRRIAQINIDVCFPELTQEQRKLMCKNCFRSTGMSVFEMALAWWGQPEKLKQMYRIEGLENLEAARQSGRPILLLSGHMSCTDIGSTFLAFHIPFQAMYKPAKNKLFETVMLSCRSRTFYEMVPRKQSRRLLKSLKNNIATWYAPDQNFGREETVFAPFFGVPATTLTATSRIVRFANAVVLPFFPYRLPDGQGYVLRIGKILDNFPSDSIMDDACQINKVIEDAARYAPEQYLWLHKRFRLRPPGEPKLY